VLSVLKRAGGITPGAEPNDVHVVRSHIADGQAPEIFSIDLRAILLRQDQRTNIRLQAYDEVFIGETTQSSLKTCVPRWLQPVYEKLVGLYRPESSGGKPVEKALATGPPAKETGVIRPASDSYLVPLQAGD
jgi:hypothetical protein